MSVEMMKSWAKIISFTLYQMFYVSAANRQKHKKISVWCI